MKKYLFLGAVILVLGLLINYSLGGFTKVKPQIVEVNDYIIYGTDYEGSYKSNKLNELVDDMRTHQQQVKKASNLVIVNYINEAAETVGIVHNFIGLQTIDEIGNESLNAFEKKIIRASKAIRIKVKIKPLVMPTPEKINEIAFKFAVLNNIILQNLSIEQYKENGVLIIEYPIQEAMP